MNSRERFLNILDGKPVDRVMNLEIGVWPQTAVRWENEGMPKNAIKRSPEQKWENAEDLFDEDFIFYDKEPPAYFKELNGRIEYTRVNTYIPDPPFEKVVYEEDDRTIVYKDAVGITHKAMKEGEVGGLRTSMDQYLSFPIENREDFF